MGVCLLLQYYRRCRSCGITSNPQARKTIAQLEAIVSELREGFYFSAGLSAQTIYNDIDKTMLARLGTLDATGIYGAAYRLIDVSFVPLSSLLAATYPIFFQKGTDGIPAASDTRSL